MLINVFSDEFVCVLDRFFFCNEAYDTVILSFPFMLNLFDILRCAANSQLLSVVMVFKDSLYGKSSVLLSDAPGGLLRPRSVFHGCVRLRLNQNVAFLNGIFTFYRFDRVFSAL